MSLRSICALGLSTVLLSCANQAGAVGDDAPDEGEDVANPTLARGRGEASVSVRYAQTAKGNWGRGEIEYADENFLAAQKYYSYIRSKFPYSAYAIRAELRIGDCLFGRGRFVEAIDAFQNFVRLHPTHNKVAYAMYRIGAAYHEQIPGDWFLIPPSHEKDQAAVRDAEKALRAYVERHPNDESFVEGKKLLDDVHQRLVDHERYAADFYKNIDKTKAYVGRLEVIRSKYSDVALTADLLLEIVEAYTELDDYAGAKDVVDQLRRKFPKSSQAQEAESLLSKIPKKKKS